MGMSEPTKNQIKSIHELTTKLHQHLYGLWKVAEKKRESEKKSYDLKKNLFFSTLGVLLGAAVALYFNLSQILLQASMVIGCVVGISVSPKSDDKFKTSKNDYEILRNSRTLEFFLQNELSVNLLYSIIKNSSEIEIIVRKIIDENTDVITGSLSLPANEKDLLQKAQDVCRVVKDHGALVNWNVEFAKIG